MNHYKNTPCFKCDKGFYREFTFNSDMDGHYRCNHCGHEVENRYDETEYSRTSPFNSHPDYLFTRNQVVSALDYLKASEEQFLCYLLMDYKFRRSTICDSFDEVSNFSLNLPYCIIDGNLEEDFDKVVDGYTQELLTTTYN